MYDDPNIINERRQRAARVLENSATALAKSRALAAKIEQRRDNDTNRAHLTDGQRRRLEPDYEPGDTTRYGPAQGPGGPQGPGSGEPFAGHGHLTADQQDRLTQIRGPHGTTGY